jgi:hypothetical protein
MTVTYEIVPHDGGWAYRLDDAYSETFPSKDAATRAAEAAAAKQKVDRATVDTHDEDALFANSNSQLDDVSELDLMHANGVIDPGSSEEVDETGDREADR